MDDNKLWKILEEMGISDHLTFFLRTVYTGQEPELELDMEQQTGSKLGKEYVKAVCYHLAYLTYMRCEKRWTRRSTSWNQDCQEKHQ